MTIYNNPTLGRQFCTLSFLLLFTLVTFLTELRNVPVLTLPLTNERTTAVERNITSLYSFMRSDRSGSAVQDMIFAAAYAFDRRVDGYHYAGACIEKGKEKSRKHRIKDHKKLILALGLGHVLRFDCPPGYHDISYNSTENVDPSSYKYYTNKGTGSYAILSDTAYRIEDLLTPSFRQYLISQRRPLGRKSFRQYLISQRRPLGRNSGRVAVHIRRGDIDPCRKVASFFRYSPNHLYLDVLDRVLGGNGSEEPRYQPEQVTYFSESQSFENFTEFHKRGYIANVGGNIERLWVEMADADVFVMSKSSFSFVPAFLNNNTVIYTPFWHQPAEGWKVVDQDLIDKANYTIHQLCEKKMSGG